MNSKELGYQVSLLEFKLKALTDKIPEVYIIGSGKVARVITENNNIYIVGEDAANDIYLRGYSDGVNAGVKAYNKFIESDFIKQIEDKIINGDPEPAWIFKRDYHGEFKKKGEGDGTDNN